MFGLKKLGDRKSPFLRPQALRSLLNLSKEDRRALQSLVYCDSCPVESWDLLCDDRRSGVQGKRSLTASRSASTPTSVDEHILKLTQLQDRKK